MTPEFAEKICLQLIAHEGYRNLPYEDSEGVLTIGVGRNLEKPLSDDVIGLLLAEDLEDAETDLIEVFPNFQTFSEQRRLALFDMMFNLGKPRFLGFKKMIAAIKEGRWDEAARQALDSKWRRQVKGRAITIARMLKDEAEVPRSARPEGL